MNEYMELGEGLNNLNSGKNIRLNINFIISGKLKNECIHINRKVNSKINGLIEFNNENLSIPHITLATVYISNIAELVDVFNEVEKISKGIMRFIVTPKRVIVNKLYSKSPYYAFLSFKEEKLLFKYKKIIQNSFSDYMKEGNKKILNEVPHVTVGCYRDVEKNDVENMYINELFSECEIGQIGVSFSGHNGVCLALMKSFDLE